MTHRSIAYRFVLENRGPARAEDVSFEFVGEEKGWPYLSLEGHEFPIALDPEQTYALQGNVSYGDIPSVRTFLRWRDEAGPHVKSLTLAVF
jgi:hypothetical protein